MSSRYEQQTEAAAEGKRLFSAKTLYNKLKKLAFHRDNKTMNIKNVRQKYKNKTNYKYKYYLKKYMKTDLLPTCKDIPSYKSLIDLVYKSQFAWKKTRTFFFITLCT